MLEEKVLETIKKNDLIEDTDRVVVRGFWWTRLYLSCRYFK